MLKSMGNIWNKSWWVSWYICSMRYIFACWNKCTEIYKLDPAHFLFAPELAWQACLKKTKVELELLTDIDMLLMVEKGIRGGIHRYVKANNHITIFNVFRC